MLSWKFDVGYVLLCESWARLRVHAFCRYPPPIKVARFVFRFQATVHNLSKLAVLDLTFLR